MSVSYTWVGWTKHKKRYDAVLLVAVALFLAAFIGLSLVGPVASRPSLPIVLIRALGLCAILMLHIVLWIGPLARLDRRLLPLLFNRRHLGVATFFVALAHATLSVLWYHGFGNLNPLVSLLASNTNYLSFSRFPFEVLGLAALAILFLMAATSHDFWNRNLSARTWKRLHMLVYWAYALLVGHVALGAMQSERHPLLAAALLLGVGVTAGLHIVAGSREVRVDRGVALAPDGTFIDACSIDEIPEGRARIVCPRRAGGTGTRGSLCHERIAIFRHGGTISAVSNVCVHQGGPLGEGKIIDGCITCPWHGWQYRPADGQSPPPFHEKIPTYEVRISGRRVLVNPRTLPPGTPTPPAAIPPDEPPHTPA
ncbi:MAG: ferric reductase-like transmembrane domain-containing protein [Phycisphaerae bacterium]|nr:ferric reductase-like transmembrane domain-containing protein [Phycisphaerae bacterium]